MMDLTHLSLKELRALDAQVKKEIENHGANEIAKARAKIQEIAQSVGIPLAELLTTKARAKSGPASVKYRHGDQKWTGRGRQPKWIKEWVESGKSLDLLQEG